jgi:hypothetical protein
MIKIDNVFIRLCEWLVNGEGLYIITIHKMIMIKCFLKRRKTRRIKNKQQNQLIKQRQGSLNGFRIILSK